ncbi:putative protease [uncultured Caudovirales phage]|uniref:Putative protease n=1 Tax=uncultured Caudovirales phage TaxID=2100421 RepID=A0A6J7W824_9CAUD|nr:putative protease [uncultured Caudovirales phage]
MTNTTLLDGATTDTDGASNDTGSTPDTLLGGTEAETSSTASDEGAATGGEKSQDGGAGEQQDGGAQTGAPDEYAEFNMPEGITLDPEVGTDLKSLAKDLDLSQEQAQKVADLGAKLTQKWGDALQSQIEAQSNAWIDAAKADKEIGGDKLNENLGLAKSALGKFGTPELRELLNTSRLANNPEVIRLLAKVGQAISDDSRAVTGTGSPSPSTLADRMYPSQQR